MSKLALGLSAMLFWLISLHPVAVAAEEAFVPLFPHDGVPKG